MDAVDQEFDAWWAVNWRALTAHHPSYVEVARAAYRARAERQPPQPLKLEET
jgi:hypothetical protein